MASGRHRGAPEPTRLRRARRLALPGSAAGLLTLAVVGVTIGAGSSSAPVVDAAGAAASRTPRTASVNASGSAYLVDRARAFSRSAKRVTLVHLPRVTGHAYPTASLDLWPSPHRTGHQPAVLTARGPLPVTGVRHGGFAQVLHQGQVRWVTARYLSPHKPVVATASTATASTGAAAVVSTASCPDGSGTESGLTTSAVRLFRVVCNAFPALSTYGGYDGHGEHSSGKAIDFMVGDPGLGQAVADWARAHASELDLYDVIWAQRIWTPERAGEGWRAMPDRGSSTANHYDHVHISVN